MKLFSKADTKCVMKISSHLDSNETPVRNWRLKNCFNFVFQDCDWMSVVI